MEKQSSLWMHLEEQMKETELQETILDAFMSHPRVLWALITHTGLFKKRHGGYITMGDPGLSDIIGILKDGGFFAFEVKLPGLEPTPLQYEYIDKINSVGGLAGWGSTIEHAYDLLKKARV